MRNFPTYATPFLGRETELNDYTQLLIEPRCRLLTLIGLGGTGKTRLAVELADRVQAHFPDGVYFVPLQPLEHPDQILQAILNTLNLQPSSNSRADALAHMEAQCLLLVLDNFEHLLDDVSLVADILNAAPGVKIIATSREPLKLQQEWLRQIPGLDSSDAIQLFADRAARLRGDLDFDALQQTIVRICQLVDGMPLAIELAAGWTKTLACHEILQELENGLAILAARTPDISERHRSMQVVFKSSWGLLPMPERTVMQRFSVFRGGCTREAAQVVTGVSLTGLVELVEKSLLWCDPRTGRYETQELLRQYAQEQLTKSGDTDNTRNAHLAYYAQLFEDHQEAIAKMQDATPLDQAETEFENLSVAWRHALEAKQFSTLLKLMPPIYTVGIDRNRTGDARYLFTAAHVTLSEITKSDAEWVIFGRVLTRLAQCRLTSEHQQQAERLLQESLSIARTHDDKMGLFLSLRTQSWFAEPARSRMLLEECVKIAHELGNTHMLDASLIVLASTLACMGQVKQSQQLYDEVIEGARVAGRENLLVQIYRYSGFWRMHWGQWDHAKHELEACLALTSRFQVPGHKMQAMVGLSCVALARGDVEDARHWAEEVLAYRNEVTSNKRVGIVFLLSHASLCQIAILEGNHEWAYQQIRHEVDQSLGKVVMHEYFRMIYMPVFGWSLCGMGEYEKALEHITSGLELALSLRASAYITHFLAIAALVLHHRGELKQTAKLIGLVSRHEASPRGFLEINPLFDAMQEDVRARLGAGAYAEQWERGSEHELEQVGQAVLRQLQPEWCDPVEQANQSLADPLTPRELEVLRLIAEGLTNAEIAEKLVITRGTVRGYINKTYHKLGVSNRVEAVTYAQEIGLL